MSKLAEELVEELRSYGLEKCDSAVEAVDRVLEQENRDLRSQVASLTEQLAEEKNNGIQTEAWALDLKRQVEVLTKERAEQEQHAHEVEEHYTGALASLTKERDALREDHARGSPSCRRCEDERKALRAEVEKLRAELADEQERHAGTLKLLDGHDVEFAKVAVPPPAPDYVPKQKRPMPVTPVEVAKEAARYRTVQARLAMRRGNYEEALRWLGDAVTACRDVKREVRAEHESKQAAADAELLLSRSPKSEPEGT